MTGSPVDSDSFSYKEDDTFEYPFFYTEDDTFGYPFYFEQDSAQPIELFNIESRPTSPLDTFVPNNLSSVPENSQSLTRSSTDQTDNIFNSSRDPNPNPQADDKSSLDYTQFTPNSSPIISQAPSPIINPYTNTDSPCQSNVGMVQTQNCSYYSPQIVNAPYPFYPIRTAYALSSGFRCNYGAFATQQYESPDFQQFIGYLNQLISGDKKIRFKKEKLHSLYEIFQEQFDWEPLKRDDKRNKRNVFLKLYQRKDLVKSCIKNRPDIYLKPLFLI